MAVPKRKTSKAKRDQRRSPNMKMKAPGLSICPQCHEPKLPHRVCTAERHFNGKQNGIGSRYRFFMAVQADIISRNKMILIKGGI